MFKKEWLGLGLHFLKTATKTYMFAGNLVSSAAGPFVPLPIPKLRVLLIIFFELYKYFK